MPKRLIPTGKCWCGCDAETSLGAFFKQGHDKRAEGWLILMEYGGVAQLLEEHGYGPGGKNLLRAWKQFEKSGA